jgi:hypothetical protein
MITVFQSKTNPIKSMQKGESALLKTMKKVVPISKPSLIITAPVKRRCGLEVVNAREIFNELDKCTGPVAHDIRRTVFFVGNEKHSQLTNFTCEYQVIRRALKTKHNVWLLDGDQCVISAFEDF